MFTLIVKIADLLGRGINTGRMNPRRQNIVKFPDSYDKDKREPGLKRGSHLPFRSNICAVVLTLFDMGFFELSVIVTLLLLL